MTDAVSLQFRLPPPGLSLPTPRSSKAVAGGTPVVDTVVVTSVWAVEVLRALCKVGSGCGAGGLIGARARGGWCMW